MKTPRKKLSIPVTRKFLDKHSQLKEAVVMAALKWREISISTTSFANKERKLDNAVKKLKAYEQKHKWEPIEKW